MCILLNFKDFSSIKGVVLNYVFFKNCLYSLRFFWQMLLVSGDNSNFLNLFGGNHIVVGNNRKNFRRNYLYRKLYFPYISYVPLQLKEKKTLYKLFFFKKLKKSCIFSNFQYISFFLIEFDNFFFLKLILNLKKKSSFFKRKFSIIKNFFSLLSIQIKIRRKKRRLLRKKIKKNRRYLRKFIYNFIFLKYFKKIYSRMRYFKTIDVSKKIKKLILSGRGHINYQYFLNKKKASKLSKFISVRSKIKNWENILGFETNVSTVLINSCIVNSFYDSFYFIRSGCVFLNRIQLGSSDIIFFKKGDVLELVVSKNYFLYAFYFNVLFRKNFVKIKTKLVRKIRSRSIFSENTEALFKQLFKNNFFFKQSIPSYIEVDFCVLSIFFIKNIISISSISLLTRRVYVYYMFRSYNWKWIN